MSMKMQGLYERAYDDALESSRMGSGHENKRNKKQSKKLAKLVQVLTAL